MVVVDGTSTANPEDLTSYIAMVETDEDGWAAVPYRTAGAKTLYVIKDGYRHAKMTYTPTDDDQIIDFPAVTLVAV